MLYIRGTPNKKGWAGKWWPIIEGWGGITNFGVNSHIEGGHGI